MSTFSTEIIRGKAKRDGAEMSIVRNIRFLLHRAEFCRVKFQHSKVKKKNEHFKVGFMWHNHEALILSYVLRVRWKILDSIQLYIILGYNLWPAAGSEMSPLYSQLLGVS